MRVISLPSPEAAVGPDYTGYAMLLGYITSGKHHQGILASAERFFKVSASDPYIFDCFFHLYLDPPSHQGDELAHGNQFCLTDVIFYVSSDISTWPLHLGVNRDV
jgi:hypothetical protein